jgi:serine/threonine protein kinase
MATGKLLSIIDPKTAVVIGSGAFGQVTEAFDPATGCVVAVKNLALQEADGSTIGKDRISALVAEIQLMKKLSHPNIVRYLGAFRTPDQLRIVMEYIAAGSVAKVINRYGKLPEAVVRVYTRDMMRGLAYLHANNVAHRDVKCDNLLLCSTGVVKLADFGCSKELVGEEAKTLTGTPLFMAPEVALNKGPYDALAADIWTAGITVIQMIAGEPPFSGQFRNPVEAIVHVATTSTLPPIPDWVSETCRQFIARCIVREPSQRATALQLLDDPFLAVTEAESARLPEPNPVTVFRPSAPSTPRDDDRPGSRVGLGPRPSSGQRISPLVMNSPPVAAPLSVLRPGSGGTLVARSVAPRVSNGSIGKSPRQHHLPPLNPLNDEEIEPRPPSAGAPSSARAPAPQ